MFLIVGLGNPGSKYDGTRHNVGFMMLDRLAGENDMIFTDSRWKAKVAKGHAFGCPVVLLKPETFMNLSGMAVRQAADFYKLPAENIMVIHDDLDIELGRLKIVANGGDGGHKGIRSTIEHLGTKKFPRLKIGVGRPPAPVLPDKYVLGRFQDHEKEVIMRKISEVFEAVRIFMQQGIAAAMTVINQKE